MRLGEMPCVGERPGTAQSNAQFFRYGGKKLPELATFLSKRGDEKKKPMEGLNEDAIMAWLVSSKNKHKEKAKK